MVSRGSVIALAAIVTLVLVPAHAAEPTYVTHDCYSVKQEPAKILFACGDGNYYVNHLHWDAWGVRRAEGTGVFHFNDCEPDCARGQFHKRSGTLVLRYRKRCRDIEKNVFRQARITYERAWEGDRKTRFGLFCPLSR
ncbi:MAG TPA: hypothetical protein VIG64_08875 [Actinomycetota bacterium]|jgi:hypothetical protein